MTDRRQFLGGAGVALLAASMASTAEAAAFDSAILSAEAKRRAALLANDFAALDRLIDYRLSYVHGTGFREGKAEYIGHLREGRSRYLSIESSEPKVIRVSPDTGVLSARNDVTVFANNAEHPMKLWITAVWNRHSSDWQLIAFQSTIIQA